MKEQGYKSIRKIMILFIIMTMLVTTSSPLVFAGEDPWTGTATDEIVIKDTVTRLSDDVYEHKVITNNKEGNNQNIDFICEVGKSDTIKIVAGYGKDNADSWSLTPTSEQAKAYEKNHPGETVVAGINADFFNMGTGQPLGALVMNGKVYNPANGRPYFGITKDGTPVIRTGDNLGDLQTAVGGDVILIDNGKMVTENTAYGAIKYSRTAIGIKEDGTIVTMVSRGRNDPISCGRTYLDMAEMLHNEGCIYALALDGGGSSTFIGRPEGTTGVQLRNSPDDGAERAVSSSILIVSTAEPTGVFDYAQLYPNNELYTPGSQVQFEAKGVDTAGAAMDIPEGVKWALAEDSKNLGEIDPDTGVFSASDQTGTVTVNMLKEGNVIGKTTIEIVVPDSITFSSDEISLGFEDKSNLGIVVRNKGRDINYKVGDIRWEVSDSRLGAFDGNTFVASDGESVTGKITAFSSYDNDISGELTVIVGKLPTVVWDFEDIKDSDGTLLQTAEEYYTGNGETPGILTTRTTSSAVGESIEIVDVNDDEPVFFGQKSLKLNYDFTNCSGTKTEGAYIGTAEGMEIPGTPTAIGVWVYAPEGVGVDWDGKNCGFWLRGYVGEAGKLQPYDFTLEPKNEKVQNGEAIPGIYWEGWQYLEADLTKYAPPYTILPGLTLRLMYVPGTGMGSQTAGSIYFDNLQFVYGTNVDDIDKPLVKSVTINDEELKDGAVINTNKISIDAIVEDAPGKYKTGVEDEAIRMYIDGINVVDNEKYNSACSGGIFHLYDVNLADGKHSVRVAAKDGFGNEVNETYTFTVDTGQAADTTLNVSAAEEGAVLGGKVNIQIKASDDTVTTSRTILKLGSQFKQYDIVPSENYSIETTYSNLNKTITIDAVRKDGASGNDGNLIATLTADIPSNLKESDLFTCDISGGFYETDAGFYNSYIGDQIVLPIISKYKLSAEPVVLGLDDVKIKVTDTDGNAVAGIPVYLASDDSVLGNTDSEGVLTTDKFSTAGEYVVYAKDEEGVPSFQYKLSVYTPQGDTTGKPHNIRFNAVSDPSSQKNITWFSNPLCKDKQVLKYAVSGTDEWKTVEASTTQLEFGTNGYNAINVNAVELNGLAENTSYDYIVGSESAYTESATFTTAVAGKKNSEFFIIGDVQDPDKEELKTVVDQINQKNIPFDFGIQIGDGIDSADSYTDWSDLGEILGANKFGGTNLISVMGNHEYYGDLTAENASKIYNNPSTAEGSHYSVEYGDVYIAVINFSNTKAPLEQAAAWLVEDAKKSDATWKILVTHQPPYYTNNGGNEPVYDVIPDAAEEAGIDVVFSGHDHSYAVTNPLKDDQIDEDNGIVYYLVGAAGSKRYDIATQDKFDYETIFRKVSSDYASTYLTVSSDKDEMQINLYDISAGLLDSLTLQSECKKNGHKGLYDPDSGQVTCTVCKEELKEYTGDAVDKDGNEYFLISGNVQTGWVTEGEEVRFYDNNGVREKVTVIEEVKSTCIIDGHIVYQAESGETKRIEYSDAGGHDYEEKDGRYICSKCGWERFEMSEVDVELNYDACTWTGNPRTPATKATDPNGNVLAKKPALFPDYYSSYKNNVDVGTATVTLTAARYAHYVDKNDWRGNYKGSVTVKYEIRPDAPKNGKIKYSDKENILSWDAAKMADEYVIYQSVNGGEWKEIATTEDTEFVIEKADNNFYNFRVGSRKTAADGKSYESLTYTTVGMLNNIQVTTGFNDEGKPTLKWNTDTGADFTVLRSTSRYGTYEEVFHTKGSTYTHVSAAVGNTYYYKVKGTLDGRTVVSDVVSVTVDLDSPVIKKADNSETGKPKLTWDKVNGAVKYEIYRADYKNGEYTKMFTTTGTTYTNTSARAGYTYYYKVKAVSGSGLTSEFSNIIGVKCILNTPVIENVYNSEAGKPKLSWKSVSGAAKYEVYRSGYSDGKYEKVFTTEGKSYTNTSAKAGYKYYYKVRAVDANGVSSEFSDIVGIRCLVTKLDIEKVSNSSVTGKPQLMWKKVDGAVRYEVYRADYSYSEFEKMFTTEGNTYTNTSAKAGYKYYYRVKAITESGKEIYSDIVDQRCILGTPNIVNVSNSSSGKPQLTWEKVDDATAYEIYRSGYKDGTYTKMYTTENTVYTNTSAKAGYIYYYKVKAIHEDRDKADSKFSEVVGQRCK